MKYSNRTWHTNDPRGGSTTISGFFPKTELTESMRLLRAKMPHIHRLIGFNWGKQVLHDRFTNMLIVDTEGRRGFPIDVLNAIQNIALYHESLHPSLVTHNAVYLARTYGRDTW